MSEDRVKRVLREGFEVPVKAWVEWYAELSEGAGSMLLGRYAEAREFYDRGISVSEAASAIAAGLTVEDYQEELDRMSLEAPEVVPEWPDLTENLFDERDRELEAQVAEVEGLRDLEKLEAETERALADLDEALEALEAGAVRAEGDVEDLGLRLESVPAEAPALSEAELERQIRTLEAETELMIRAAEANRPDLAPRGRRPSLSARHHVGSSFSG